MWPSIGCTDDDDDNDFGSTVGCLTVETAFFNFLLLRGWCTGLGLLGDLGGLTPLPTHLVLHSLTSDRSSFWSCSCTGQGKLKMKLAQDMVRHYGAFNINEGHS